MALLNYTGDAALGLGSTPGIPAISEKDNLNVINQTTRDLLLLDNQRNLKIFQQKIADRDTLARQIMDDKVSTGDILPQYQSHFDDAKKNVESAFFKWKGNFNDMKGFSKYKDAVQNLKDVAAHAQTNTTEIKKLQQQAATEPLPNKKNDMQRWIGRQTDQDFWSPVVPYQQLHDLNMDTFPKYVQPITSVETPDKSKPYMSYDVTRVSFPDIKRRTLNGYINDLDQTNDIEQLFNKFQGYNQQGLKQALDAMDGQINKYNAENNYTQGTPSYVNRIKRATDDKGNTVIAESQVDFAAKYALANQAKFVTTTPKFSKDLANYDLGLKKLDLAARKLGIEGEKARAYVRNLNAKTEKYFKENTDEATNIIKEYNDFIDHMQPGGVVVRDKKSGATVRPINPIFLDELPAGYQYINGPIMGVKETTDKSGKKTITPTGKIEVGRLQPFLSSDDAHRPYYIARYINAQTGSKMEANDPFLKRKFQETRDSGVNISYDDYIRTLLKKGILEMTLQGKNGAANYTSMAQSAKLINAQTTKKGRENVINPPESVQDAESETEEDQ